jgi:hypothetical protein
MIRKILAFTAFSAALATSAFADSASRNGQFTSASDDVTSGGVTITQGAAGYVVQLGPKFFLDGAPDPKVGFGKDGSYVAIRIADASNDNTREGSVSWQ